MGEKTLLGIFREKTQAIRLARAKGYELVGIGVTNKAGRYCSVAVFECTKRKGGART